MTKLQAVIIIGPDMEISDSIKTLYSKKGFLLIGDGISPISLQMIEDSLEGNIDAGTRIDIIMHGEPNESGQHFVMSANFTDQEEASEYGHICMIPTVEIFKLLYRLLPLAPLEVHLHSCYSASALQDINNLATGSALITYASEDEPSLLALGEEGIIDIIDKIQDTEILTENIGKLNLQLALDNIIFRMVPGVSFALSGVEGAIMCKIHNPSLADIKVLLNDFYILCCHQIQKLSHSEDISRLMIKPSETYLLSNDNNLINNAASWCLKSWFAKECILGNQEFLQFLETNQDITKEMVTKKVHTTSILQIAAGSNNSEIFQHLWPWAKSQGVQLVDLFNNASPYCVLRYAIKDTTLEYLLDELEGFNTDNPNCLKMEQYSMLLFSLIGNQHEEIWDKFFKITQEAKLDIGHLLTTRPLECTILSVIAEGGNLAILNKVQKLANDIGIDITDQFLILRGDEKQNPLHIALYYPDRPSDLVVALYNFASQSTIVKIVEILSQQDVFGKTPKDYDIDNLYSDITEPTLSVAFTTIDTPAYDISEFGIETTTADNINQTPLAGEFNTEAP